MLKQGANLSSNHSTKFKSKSRTSSRTNHKRPLMLSQKKETENRDRVVPRTEENLLSQDPKYLQSRYLHEPPNSKEIYCVRG